MVGTDGPRTVERRPPDALGADDEGREVKLQQERPCPSCGHYIDVAKIVKLADGEYEYLCLGCAVRFERTGRLKIKETPKEK